MSGCMEEHGSDLSRDLVNHLKGSNGKFNHVKKVISQGFKDFCKVFIT